jgi:dUTP pyrophosphatase
MSRSYVDVPIRKLYPDAIVPEQTTTGAVGFDLHARIDGKGGHHRLYPGQWKVIGCGIAIELPEGYEAQIRPRSGLAAKRALTIVNTPGTIDWDFRGEISATIINHGNTAFDIQEGDRIAQMVIMPVPLITLRVVDELSSTERGAGGLGSTGVSK